MFSTFTDRFFHGMNKKHTKMVNASNLKANLQTSRSRRSSRSKQKTARMFDTNPNYSNKSSLNSTVRVGTSIDNFRSTNSQFALPPQLHNEKKGRYYHRKNNQPKNSTIMFTPPLAAGELQDLLEKHIGEASGKEPLTDRENSNDPNNNSVLLSFKQKLRQKIEQNAIKKFSNIYHAQNKTGRVEEQNIKQLLSLISKDKNKQVAKHSNDQKMKQIYGKQSENEQNSNPKGHIQKEVKQTDKLNLEQKKHQHQAKLKVSADLQPRKKETIIAEPKTQNQYSKLKKQADQKKTKEETNNKISSAVQDKVSTVNPPKDPNVKPRETKVQQIIEKPKSQMQIEENKRTATNPVTQKKIEDPPKEVVNARAEKDIRKSNSFWNQNIESMFEDPPAPVQPIRENKLEQNKVAVVHPQTHTTDRRTKTSNSAHRSEQIDSDELDEIQLEVTKPQKPKADANYSKSKIPSNQKSINNETQKPKNSIQGSVKAPQTGKNDVKQTKKGKQDLFLEYNLMDTEADIEYILSLISEIGFYAQNLIKFYSQTETKAFNQDSLLLCYLLWQYFYYLKSKCLRILKDKQENFFYVPKRALTQSSVQQFINENIEAIQQQNEKAIKRVEKSHQMVKQTLPADQKKFSMNKENYYERCLRYLQKQFQFIEKIYRESVNKSAKKLEDTYIDRLCKIIEIFCLIKFLGGEKKKEFIQSEEIQNLTKHYQDYKHLVVL